MATTRIISMHINKGKTIAQCLKARLDYVKNPDKTEQGKLISAYACAPETADQEFLLNRNAYIAKTGRRIHNEVIAYQVRQSFQPGEVTPEEANKIGYELASRLLNGDFAFLVATHDDHAHIHNHIVFSAVSLDCTRKFKDVLCSGKVVAKLSDSLCREHRLSIVENPQDKTVSYDKWQGSSARITSRDTIRMMIDSALRMQPDGFDALMQLLEDVGCRIKRGTQISIKPPEGERYIRLDTLVPEYDEATLRRSLTGDHVHIPKIPRGDFTESQIKRLVDIEAKLRAGKGKGYQVWAERNNIDAKAQMVIFLKEHHIGSLEELNEQIQELTDQRNSLKASIREKQNRMKEINRQRQAIRDYSRTKEVYTQYRESNWSVKFYQEHRQEIEDHKNAQAVYSSLDGKMPTLKELTAEYDSLKEQKENDQAALDKLKPKLTDLKHVRYNYEILERDSAPNSHQHVIPKDHHYDEHGANHDDESR